MIDQTKERVRAGIMAHVVGERALDRLVGLVEGAFAACDGSGQMAAISRLCDALEREPEVADQVERPWSTWEGITTALILEAQAEGDVPPEIDAAGVAAIAVGGYFGLELMCRDEPGRMAALREPFIDHFLTVLGARRARA